ncbi:hypothetical protein HOF65_00310 [bacterium]|nr:hypothetical protein [bacterium]MBT6778324.1 hypothetical protein [bacterium]
MKLIWKVFKVYFPVLLNAEVIDENGSTVSLLASSCNSVKLLIGYK